MRLKGFPKLTVNIVRKDWLEYRKPLFGVAFAIFGGVLLNVLFTPERSNFSRGVIAGVIFGGSLGFAQFCFFNERQRSTLQLLLSLPVDPMRLVFAKYASLFSMVLFNVNLPGVVVGDLRFLLFANLVALLLSTICMASTVISGKPWAPQLPLWIIVGSAIPAFRLIPRSVATEALLWVVSRPFQIGFIAFLLIPLIVFVSAFLFRRQVSR